MIPRQLEQDDEIGGYRIPAGTQVAAATMALHFRDDLWAGPEQFDPERFLALGAGAQHAFQMLSFGAGPRLCLGINLAYMEAQLMIGLMLRRFEFDVRPGWMRRSVHRYSMHLDGGLPSHAAPPTRLRRNDRRQQAA